MDLRNRRRRRLAVWSSAGLAAAAVPAVIALALVAAPAAGAAGPEGTAGLARQQAARPAADPYSPAYQHAYRHGAVPTRAAAANMRRWAARHPAQAAAGQATSAAATSSRNLRYGGGSSGIGVTTGHPKVYLVFYGTQWGSKGSGSNGDVTLGGDPSGEAPYLQEMFAGLGTSSEHWSGVMTQYCQGVTVGTQHCPASNTHHVAYPAANGALRGVWVDENRASPGQASQWQLGREAVRAASHFGNTTASANRNTQYVILSPTGTHPDGFNAGALFCAWHDWNGDVGVSSGYGHIAFTNMPYVTDAGADCGLRFVNSGPGGDLDGVSIVEGHEYAETITDQNPVGGWLDRNGEENADKCAWHAPGTTGGAFNLSLATGTFAMQGTWSNDAKSGTGACADSHSIVTNP